MHFPKVVVITGASAGVGRALARKFASEGCYVALIARGQKGLESALEEVRQLGGDGMIFPLDVADYDSVDEAAEEIEYRLGPIDIWVNNAMLSVFGNFLEVTPKEFKRVTEVSYLGYVHGTYAALKRMRHRNWGTIVQVSSALAFRSIPLQSAYCGAKHAIEGFTDSIRSELLHEKSAVKLTSVILPAINTPQFKWSANRMGMMSQPVPPIYQPEIAAEGIYYAAIHQKRNFYVGARTLPIVKSTLIAPSIGDYFLAKYGFSLQQTDTPLPKHYQENLWRPLDENTDFGVHGDFNDRAVKHSWHVWLVTNKKKVFTLVGLGAAYLALRFGKKEEGLLEKLPELVRLNRVA